MFWKSKNATGNEQKGMANSNQSDPQPRFRIEQCDTNRFNVRFRIYLWPYCRKDKLRTDKEQRPSGGTCRSSTESPPKTRRRLRTTWHHRIHGSHMERSFFGQNLRRIIFQRSSDAKTNWEPRLENEWNVAGERGRKIRRRWLGREWRFR